MEAPARKLQSGFYSVGSLVLIVIVLWFFLILPIQKREKVETSSKLPVTSEEIEQLPIDVRVVLSEIKPKRVLTRADIQAAETIVRQQSALSHTGK